MSRAGARGSLRRVLDVLLLASPFLSLLAVLQLPPLTLLAAARPVATLLVGWASLALLVVALVAGVELPWPVLVAGAALSGLSMLRPVRGPGRRDDRRDDDENDPGPEDPEPLVDWARFDRERRRWAGDRDREPAGTR